jgi:hypothetical protein
MGSAGRGTQAGDHPVRYGIMIVIGRTCSPPTDQHRGVLTVFDPSPVLDGRQCISRVTAQDANACRHERGEDRRGDECREEGVAYDLHEVWKIRRYQ